jgi:hypothetical protein
MKPKGGLGPKKRRQGTGNSSPHFVRRGLAATLFSSFNFSYTPVLSSVRFSSAKAHEEEVVCLVGGDVDWVMHRLSTAGDKSSCG